MGEVSGSVSTKVGGLDPSGSAGQPISEIGKKREIEIDTNKAFLECVQKKIDRHDDPNADHGFSKDQRREKFEYGVTQCDKLNDNLRRSAKHAGWFSRWK